MKKFLEICGGIDVGKREIAVTILKGPTTAEQAFLNHLAQVIVEPVSIQGLANVEEPVDCLGSSIGFAMAPQSERSEAGAAQTRAETRAGALVDCWQPRPLLGGAR